MKKYCYIENGEVALANQELPKVWKNVSNFHLLPDQILKTYGWFPLVIETENKPIFISSNYIIEENLVREIIITREKTTEELEEENQKEIEERWSQIRIQRDEILKQSDLLVLIDKWELLTEEQKQEIRNYRQALRDVPQAFESPEDVVWPQLL